MAQRIRVQGVDYIFPDSSGGGGNTGGGFGVPTAVKTSNYTASAGDFVRADPTLGGFNVTLPSAAAATNGGVVSVKNISSSINTVTVLFTGGNTTDDGATSVVLLSQDTATFVSDGVSDWMRA